MTVNCSLTSGSTELGPTGSTSGTISCGQFDTTLGTLTSIDLTLQGAVISPSSLTINNNSGSSNSGSATTASDFTLDTALSGFGFSNSNFDPINNVNDIFSVFASTGTQTLGADPNAPAACGGLSVCSGSFNVTGSGSASQTNTSSGTFFTYEGLGSFNITADTKTGFAASFSGGNVSVTQATTDSFTATVVYNYAPPSSVPEPTTLFLMGSALVGLGVFRKRSKS